MGKLLALLDLFRKGDAVSNPALWKLGQISATMIGGLILAIINLSKVFGYDLQIDAEGANAIGAAILIIVNSVLTITTSPTVGLPAKGTPNKPERPANVFGGGTD